MAQMITEGVISVEYVNHCSSEQEICKIAGLSHGSRKGPTIGNLLAWGHLSPFEFASITYKIQCPIFVARQLMRHRTGHYLEKSLRYCEAEPVVHHVLDEEAEKLCLQAFETYHSLLDKGFDREDARSVLPVGTYTEFYAQYDLKNLINLLRQRLASNAQAETRKVAQQMALILSEHFPTVANAIIMEVE
ncbi:MAG: FAD-dependent thymidylate synthase [Sphaerochaeta sp.]|uniref:FAD-dependent thymidylate synthase n=1 Tax=Sphaerochaeta sp. TaxID=1972642 RepID=UPI003D140AB9